VINCKWYGKRSAEIPLSVLKNSGKPRNPSVRAVDFRILKVTQDFPNKKGTLSTFNNSTATFDEL
jgi:hypothetical protein